MKCALPVGATFGYLRKKPLRTVRSSAVLQLLFLGVALLTLQPTSAAQESGEGRARAIQITPARLLTTKDSRSRFDLSFSQDGKRLALKEGPDVTVWTAGTGKQLVSLQVKELCFVGQVVLCGNGGRIGYCHPSTNQIQVVEMGTGQVVRAMAGPGKDVEAVAVSPDGKYLGSSSRSGTSLWELETGKELKDFRCKFGGYPLLFSPQGTKLVGWEAETVHLLDVAHGKDAPELEKVDAALRNWRAFAFSRDGRFLAAGASGGDAIIVWDARTGKCVHRFCWIQPATGHEPPASGEPKLHRIGWINGLFFAPDGRTLFATCEDGKIRAWEMCTGQLRLTVEDSAYRLLAVPYRGQLFAMSKRGEKLEGVYLWDFSTWLALPTGGTLPDPDRCWADLGSAAAPVAFERIRELAANPSEALRIVEARMRPVSRVDPAVVERLIKDLDDESFDVRQRAKLRLAKLAEIARPRLRKALEAGPSLEASKHIKELLKELNAAPKGDRLQLIRAVEVLEWINSRSSRDILDRLSSGEPDALLTREAKAAIARLDPGQE